MVSMKSKLPPRPPPPTSFVSSPQLEAASSDQKLANASDEQSLQFG